MSRPIEFRRLRSEDFSPDNQELISKLAFSYNNFGEQVVEALRGNIDFDNLRRELRTINVQVNEAGNPIVPVEFLLSKLNQVRGLVVISAFNLSSPGVYPTGAPFISFIQNGSKVTILNIKGLTTNDLYQLNIEVL